MVEEAWHLQIYLFWLEKICVLMRANGVNWFPDAQAVQQHDTEPEQSSLGDSAYSCSLQPLIC